MNYLKFYELSKNCKIIHTSIGNKQKKWPSDFLSIFPLFSFFFSFFSHKVTRYSHTFPLQEILTKPHHKAIFQISKCRRSPYITGKQASKKCRIIPQPPPGRQFYTKKEMPIVCAIDISHQRPFAHEPMIHQKSPGLIFFIYFLPINKTRFFYAILM